jgi:hypothetical protein
MVKDRIAHYNIDGMVREWQPARISGSKANIIGRHAHCGLENLRGHVDSDDGRVGLGSQRKRIAGCPTTNIEDSQPISRDKTGAFRDSARSHLAPHGCHRGALCPVELVARFRELSEKLSFSPNSCEMLLVNPQSGAPVAGLIQEWPLAVEST